MRDMYDLAVIGGGSAGLTAARFGVALGARVALIERSAAGPLGGDCLHTGCVPQQGAHPRRTRPLARPAHRGLRPPRPPFHRTGRSRCGHGRGARRDRSRRRSRHPGGPARHRYPPRISARGALPLAGTPGGGRCAGASAPLHRRDPAASPALPPVAGLRETAYHTNETIFGLDTLPTSLLVLGGGPIGCELGQAFARLGARVTIVGRAPRLLPREDPEASEALARAFAREGLTVLHPRDG